jgi:hypothetical protein
VNAIFIAMFTASNFRCLSCEQGGRYFRQFYLTLERPLSGVENHELIAKRNQTSGSSWCRSGRAVNVRLADLIAQQQKRIIQWLHREKCPM